MKVNKVILIGAIDKGNIATNGETMKNQMLLQRFEDLYDKVVAVDAYNWRKRPWCFFEILWSLIWNRGAKVVISASGAASWLYDFLYYIPLKKNVNDWVIGGSLPLRIEQGVYHVKSLAKLNRVIVEGEQMVKDLQAKGLNNVVRVPNFKPVEYKVKLKEKHKGEPYHFVFLSRVHPDKGISEIIAACKELNSQGYQEKYTMSLYGPIEKGYEAIFEKEVKSCSNIEYKGFLNLMKPEGYDELSQYDVMLFPTYWDGEGFPGIVIDAYIAGLPIIASDWNMNKEVVKDGKTGYIVPVKDSKSLAAKMLLLMENDALLNQMRKDCAAYATQFDYRNVVTRELLEKLNLL